MVLVSALVVHPGRGIAEKLTLGDVGTALAVIVFCAGNKFGGRIF